MTREDIFTALRANLEQVVEGAQGQEIGEHNKMADYGADSLEIVEVLSRTMRQLKIKVPRAEMSKATNFGDLLDLFQNASTGASTHVAG